MEFYRPQLSENMASTEGVVYKFIHYISIAISSFLVISLFMQSLLSGIVCLTLACLFHYFVGPRAWNLGNVFRKFVFPKAYTSRGVKDAFNKRIYWIIGPQWVAYYLSYFCLMSLPFLIHSKQ